MGNGMNTTNRHRTSNPNALPWRIDERSIYSHQIYKRAKTHAY